PRACRWSTSSATTSCRPAPAAATSTPTPPPKPPQRWPTKVASAARVAVGREGREPRQLAAGPPGGERAVAVRRGWRDHGEAAFRSIDWVSTRRRNLASAVAGSLNLPAPTSSARFSRSTARSEIAGDGHLAGDHEHHAVGHGDGVVGDALVV